MSEEYERYMGMASRWDASFTAQAQESATNSVPPEAIVRNVSYYLRNRNFEHFSGLRFLDLGCGAGQTTLWLAQKGLDVTGIDISSTALSLARNALASEAILDATLLQRVHFYEGSIVKIPFPDGSFQGIVEANVIQHLVQEDRAHVFAEIRRLLVPGGLLVAYLMAETSSAYRRASLANIPELGSLLLEGGSSPYHLGSTGLTHFFKRRELEKVLEGFAHVDVLAVSYDLPEEEVKRRGEYSGYHLDFWNVFAVR